MHPGKHAHADGRMFCGYHKKYAIDVVQVAPPAPAAARRPRRLDAFVRDPEERIRLAAAARLPRRLGALARQMQEEQVVFVRDPEDGIHLAAFAQDRQNVHRSSVQSTTEKAIHTLLQQPVPADQDTLSEVHAALTTCNRHVWQSTRKTMRAQLAVRDSVMYELPLNYVDVRAFNVSYGDLLDHVWARIRSNVHREELVLRLAQELNESLQVCSNGKMTRLVNVLQGFEEAIAIPSRDAFQHKIAALAGMPLATRESAARALFDEYAIPAVEQRDWLEAVMDA